MLPGGSTFPVAMHAADSVSGGVWDGLPKQVYPLHNTAAVEEILP